MPPVIPTAHRDADRDLISSRGAISGATVALALIACVLVAACGRDSHPDRPAAGRVKLIEPGRLKTCTHLAYRPFEFKRRGKIVGFDFDVVDLIAKQLGVRTEIVDTPFEAIQSGAALDARTCDIAAAAMTITPQRQQKIAFSAPYFDADQGLLVRKGSAIHAVADLRGKTVGVLAGTTGEAYAQQHARPAGARLKRYRDLSLQLGDVKSGAVAAAINDIPVLLDYAQHDPGVQVSARLETGEQYGLGMKHAGSDALRQVVNRVIARAKADGTYDRLYETWFGAAPG
jgi:polar amino acid transport system substrate-binding protein